MKIEFLFFESCPHHEAALKLLKRVLKDEDVHAPITSIDITSEQMAQQFRFLGSPSIRINGKDVEGPASTSRLEIGRKCRIYQSDGKLSGLPPEHKIRKVVQEARGNA